MRNLWAVVIPLVLLILSSGCSMSRKTIPAETEEQQQIKFNQILEQVDRNVAAIRETKSGVTELSRQFEMLENKLNTMLTENNAAIQEITESISFMNDQILRLDNSIQTRRPVSKPKAASVFKPGGFDLSASYKGSLNEYYAKRYESAIGGFTEVLTVAPNSPLADNAQYWIGESYYSMGNYEKAVEAFGKVFDFPESNKIADAHLKIGLTYNKMGNKNSAREELHAVVVNYPDSDASKIAAQYLSKLGE